MADLLQAWQSRMVHLGGTAHKVRRGEFAHPDADVVRDYPDLWEPVIVNYPAADETQIPADDVDTGPTAREVRAWAREQGIDVPDRGRIPGDVIDQYIADQHTDLLD